MAHSSQKMNSEESAIVRECLANLLKKDLFAQSERQSRFLEYVVEKTIEGDGRKLNQFSIGIDVFDRDESFDPAIDSIVRVEAGRLRAKLREYYSDVGNEDIVQIEIRKGKYVANFEFKKNITPNVTIAQNVSLASIGPTAVDNKPVIAVLAFTNTSGDPEQEYFADGISEDIITDLSKFSDLAVIARHSSFAYKNKNVDTGEIASQLGADFILEGSVRKAGEKVRITAQLIGVKGLRQLWAERYDRSLDDIFSVQDDVTREIIRALKLKLKGDEKTSDEHTTNLEAYDCVLRGAEYARQTNREDRMQARALFRKAISLDPEYAEAYARLSRLYVYQWISGLDNTGELILGKAKELALRAVEICPDSAFAHAALGWAYEWLHENDLAVAEWLRAIELDASQAEAFNWLSLNLAWSGQTEQAKEKIDCAKRLNPLEEYCFPYGMVAYMEGNYKEAITLFQKLVTQDPAFIPAYLFLASCYEICGENDKGKVAVQSILQINPGYRISVTGRASIRVPEISTRFRTGLIELGIPRGE